MDLCLLIFALFTLRPLVSAEAFPGLLKCYAIQRAKSRDLVIVLQPTARPLFASSENAVHTDANEEETKSYAQNYRPGSMMAATSKLGRVPYGEESRKYRQTIFGHDDWVKHRSTDRFTENLNTILVSGIVRQVWKQVLVIVVAAVAVLGWNGFIVPLSRASDVWLPTLTLPTLPFTLSSPALALLLVFRTNTSYGRWLEARQRWGTIVSHCRNIVRMAATCADLTTRAGRRAVDGLGMVCWAFSRSLANELSGPEDDAAYEGELRARFGNDGDDNTSPFATRLLSAPDRPLAALAELSLTVEAMPVDEKRRVEMDKSLVIMGECVCACERIHSSPVPLVYTRHTARFLSLWLLLLPMSLYSTFATVESEWTGVNSVQPLWSQAQGLDLVPAMALISLFLFGIEELAVQLEEPFTILPMQTFCDGVREASKDMLDWCISSSAGSFSVDE